MSENVLKIEGLEVRYATDDGVVEAVNGINIEVDKGKTLGLVGETGAGKTTTAMSILKLVPYPPGLITGGKIVLDGEEITEATEKQMEKIRGNIVSMIFQDPMTALNPVITVGDQISEAISIHQDATPEEAKKKAREMLEMVGIPGARMNEYPHQFSGGMKQRVVIAIALSCSPKLLIADEPTTALDVTIQAQVLELMKELKVKYNMAMIMITHDLGVVAEVCDDVAIMYAGRIIEQGTIEEIFRDTRHPYTEGLFNSIPNIDDRQAELKPIRGLMSDPYNLPEGCSFYDRCDYATDICRHTKPEKIYFSDTHFTECHLYNDDKGIKLESRKKEGGEG
jgi:peptide/nickel transport system ATP-binding protein